MIRSLCDGVVPLPTQIKLPLKKHIREIRRLSGLKTALYERRALLLALGARLLPFVRLGLRTLELSAKYAQEMILILKPSEEQSGGQITPETMDQF